MLTWRMKVDLLRVTKKALWSAWVDGLLMADLVRGWLKRGKSELICCLYWQLGWISHHIYSTSAKTCKWTRELTDTDYQEKVNCIWFCMFRNYESAGSFNSVNSGVCLSAESFESLRNYFWTTWKLDMLQCLCPRYKNTDKKIAVVHFKNQYISLWAQEINKEQLSNKWKEQKWQEPHICKLTLFLWWSISFSTECTIDILC